MTNAARLLPDMEKQAIANSAHVWCLALVLGLGAGCGGSDRSPTTPSTIQSTPAPRPNPGGIGDYVWDVTLSGVFYERTPTGRIPIEGVVWFSNDESALGHGITGVDGFFSVTPVWVCPCPWAPTVEANMTSLYWKKEGYTMPPGHADSSLYPGLGPGAGSRDIRIAGHTRLEIELVRE